MPAAHRLGDICTGHGCFPPRPNVSASPDVFVNGIALHRKTDGWAPHCCIIPCHSGALASGSPVVLANFLEAARIGDPVDCGSAAATGSGDVFIGDSGSFAFTQYPETPVTPTPYQVANFGPPSPNHNPEFPGIGSNPEYPPDPDVPPASGTRCEYGENGASNPYDLVKTAVDNPAWKETGKTPNILNTYKEVGHSSGTDQLAWCAAFAGTMLKRTGNEYLKTLTARDYLNYGDAVPGSGVQQQLQNAQRGDIVVFSRNGGGKGHVAFFDGFENGQLCVIGGNQGPEGKGAVTRSCGGISQVLGVRRPKACKPKE